MPSSNEIAHAASQRATADRVAAAGMLKIASIVLVQPRIERSPAS